MKHDVIATDLCAAASHGTHLEFLDPIESGKALRSALRAEFPGTVFSVHMSRGPSYGSFHIEWIDGPETLTVDRVARQFEGKHGLDNETTFPRNRITWRGRVWLSGCGYIFLQRCSTIVRRT